MVQYPNWGHPDHDACGTGFVAKLGRPVDHEVVQYALTALERLTHRGGMDADGASGDGAGLLLSLPDLFFRAQAKKQRVVLPEEFGIGQAFFPNGSVRDAQAIIENTAREEHLRVLGWRQVPVDAASLGPLALHTKPEIWQFFVGPAGQDCAGLPMERQLTFLRKRLERKLPANSYICSLSSRTIVYKGLLTPWQLLLFYEDLRDPTFAASFAIFHQRYSTNTQPSWNLAQPFRHVAHNGEINTIVSNRRWLRAKEPTIRENLNADPWFQALEDNVSDSASFDNGFEIKLLEGMSAEEAMLALEV